MKKIILSIATAIGIMAMIPTSVSAHCDTMDGPTVADGKKAMENNNVNYALKWVQLKDENEIIQFIQKEEIDGSNKKSTDKFCTLYFCLYLYFYFLFLLFSLWLLLFSFESLLILVLCS